MLEDHLGDIVRKARAAAGVSAETAALGAGVSLADFTTLEAEGTYASLPNFASLAGLIGLHPAKLESIANGWLPAATNLGRWREFRRITTTASDITVHCHLIWDEATLEAALFDTGWDPAPVLQLIARERLCLRHLFLSHTHEDHIAALGGIRDAFPKVRIHSSSARAPLDQRNRANDFVHIGSLRITNRDTPGHSEDGVTYLIGNWPEDAPHVAIVGDAIFAGSMGTGFVSWELAKQKVRDQIFTLPAETLICPGHGPMTTVAEEMGHNPFFS